MAGFPTRRRRKKDFPAEGTISELRPLTKDPSRIGIKIEGGYVGSLPMDKVDALDLTEGKYLTPAFMRQLRDAIEEADCRWQALNLLSYRPRSVAEISRRLKAKGFGKYLIQRIITWLLDKGYLNDAEFARAMVRSKTEGSKPLGSFVLRRKLLQAGVDDENIEVVLGEIESEYQNCRRAADGALKRYRDLDRRKARQRLYAYLARRGFPVDDIKMVLLELEQQLGRDEVEEG